MKIKNLILLFIYVLLITSIRSYAQTDYTWKLYPNGQDIHNSIGTTPPFYNDGLVGIGTTNLSGPIAKLHLFFPFNILTQRQSLMIEKYTTADRCSTVAEFGLNNITGGPNTILSNLALNYDAVVRTYGDCSGNLILTNQNPNLTDALKGNIRIFTYDNYLINGNLMTGELERFTVLRNGQIGIGNPEPTELLSVGKKLNFHTGSNYYFIGFNEYVEGNDIKRATNKNPYSGTGDHDPEFSGALVFNSSQLNGDGLITLGTAGLGLKDEVITNSYTEPDNGFRGLSIMPTTISNQGMALIGLGSFPTENNRVNIKGLTTNNSTSALTVTNHNNSKTMIYAQDDGNVGIGITNPKTELQVGTNFTVSNFNSAIGINTYLDASDPDWQLWKNKGFAIDKASLQMGVTGGGTAEGAFFYVDKCSTLSQTIFEGYHWDDTKLKGIRILTNGNIGIGKWDPLATLSIKSKGTTDQTKAFTIENSNTSSPTEMLTVLDNGYIGIGTSTPSCKLMVKSALNTYSTVMNVVNSDNNSLFEIHSDGKIDIGGNHVSTSSAYYNEYKLAVNGTVIASKVVVSTSEWADNVFKQNYNLMPLIELENYIKLNQKLPEIPSEKEAIEEGVDIAKLNTKLLKKIEELTLYVIELKKENQEIKKIIENKK